ncbi:alkaline phosphatase family protein [Pendulispora albinea]|uniref:Alkaline phosphatase family protein n=1 Tax=Pendulispora albinea TaxID=2741071 RepID=A0ABZ2LZX0_9BACT
MTKARTSLLVLGIPVAMGMAALGACSSDDTLVVPPRDGGVDAYKPPPADAGTSLSNVGHVVVIFLENHSFDNLYGSYPGAEGLSSPTAKIPQINSDTGQPYATLPQANPQIPEGLPNEPFDITKHVPANQKTRDLVHRWYQEMGQINGGKMDLFVTKSDALGLSFGYYPTAQLPLVKLINSMPSNVTVCDHFFHAAFGGSFLNHIWLIAAATPTFPGAPASMRAQVDKDGNMIKDGVLTPEGDVVNTAYSVNAPYRKATPVAERVPNQTLPTIGDQLTAASVDWAWYSGGWNDALADKPDPTFQYHHQPFVYFEPYADGKPGRSHLKDEAEFITASKSGTLPPVSFVKPVGTDNEHPGYADLETGQKHVVELIQGLMNGPSWNDTVVIVTYDENGGFWDHVAPPKTDKWGPGSRVPAIVFSKFARSGVDSTVYDTTAILRFIEKRWNMPALNDRVGRQEDLSAHALRFDR